MTSEFENPPASERDDCLVRRVRGGDRAALEILVQRHWRAAYNRAYHILRSREDAEDVAQDALLSAVTHLDSYTERAAFSTWLQRIVINRTLMLLRARHSSPLHLAVEFRDERYASPRIQYDPERLMIASENTHLISVTLRSLKGIYREPLWRNMYGEESISEIARQIGVSGGTVKIRLHRARKQLSQKVGAKLRKD